jgi:NAD(P)-dependent dehydrogenase (short-subunit alcohol dehydrogenase family)
MTDMTRRTLLLSTALLGTGVLTACSSAPTRETPPAPGTQQPSGGGTAAGGARYGVGSYNTQEVADELRYIEENIRPLGTGGERKRILVTGSTAGLGQLAAAHLLARGHRVVSHARNEQRAADVRRDLPGLETVVVGELRDLDETRSLTDQINKLGAFDVIINNAGEYGLSGEEMLNANSLSPYLLTALVNAPAQLIYLTSDLHLGGDLEADALRSGGREFSYEDTKTQVLTLAMAVARRRPTVRVNAVAPGWVPTVMGFHNGPYAPDNLRAGYMTQVWLAEGIEPASRVTGEFFFHQAPENRIHADVRNTGAQDRLLDAYAQRTGATLN